MNTDLMTRSERNNRIINGVMSGHAPVLLLCPSSPSYFDFLSDLVNNYRTVFYYDAAWETQTDFLLCIAKKVLEGEEYAVAESFTKCLIDDYKTLLLKKILSKIELIPNDCLFFFNGLQELGENFDMSLFEFILANSPDNLKIVFCSTTVPRMSYQINGKNFPRIIICDHPGEELPFDGSVFGEKYISDAQRDGIFRLSCFSRVHKNFAELVCPGVGEVIGALARSYRHLVFTFGEYYVFHPKLHDFLKGICHCEDDFEKNKTEYVRFYFDSAKYVMAMEKAFYFERMDYAEKAMENLFYNDRADYIVSYVKENDLSLPDTPLYTALKKSIRSDYDGALASVKNIENDIVRQKLFYLLSFHTEKRKEAFHSLCDEVQKDYSFIENCIRLLLIFNYSEKKHLGSLPGFMEWTDEKLLVTTKDISYLHCISKLHSANGNYASAKKYLVRIRELCDYYVYSDVQSWTFFFNMPIDIVMTYAQETENKSLEICSYLYRGNKTQALAGLKAVSDKNAYTSEGLLGAALKSILYGEAGDPDSGRSMSLLYAVSCEREKKEESSLLYTSLAYCEWLLRNNIKALAYLQHGKRGYVDAFFFFIAKALEINCTMDRERVSVIDKQVEDLFVMAQTCGFDNAILILQSCFVPLLSYAQRREICSEYVMNVQTLLSKRKVVVDGKKNIQIKFFGNSAVYIDRREISWKTKKCKELFLLYKLNPDGLERNKIIDEIWSDYVYASAVNNLKTTNNLIRKTLREYGVKFEFVYSNGKYKLLTDYSESDYEIYLSLIKEYACLQDVRKKTVLVNRMLAYFDEGFAPDCELVCFRDYNGKIKEEVSLHLSSLIKDLIREDDYTNAKRFLMKLERIGLFDCAALRTEIDKMVYKR